jgi:predicted dehydrogenase
VKQVLQFRRSGATRVVEVPAPLAPAGGLLVRNHCSLISPGTERMLVEASGANLINTARQRPDLVRQVVDKAMRDGVPATLETIRGRLDVAIPLGYSCAGTVLEVGDQIGGYAKGDRVACAGAGQANHAEYVAVLKNLTVRVPEGVSYEDAAFVTVGAIALHGVRQAQVQVGECCVVVGLGLVGLLTVQLLAAAGCRVFGIDVAADKLDLARGAGASDACLSSNADLVERVRAFSDGRGVDAVLITAATSSSEPVQQAAKYARDRATVVAVGMVGLDVPRNAYYEKELQLRLSRSYGPGRYDRTYEEQGVDYPLGYVRWTEQRNMQAFLDLVAQGKVCPGQLVTHRLPIEQAEHAYRIVTGQVAEPYLGILLEYPHSSAPAAVSTRVDLPAGPAALPGAPRLGVVGAGNFARSVLLPALRRLDVQLAGVAAASGPSAQQTATRFGFAFAATDWQQVIADCDAVIIATRHDLHASVAAAALRAGKSVFLEKPMALSPSELDELLQAWRQSGGVLQVGFNRRFAPSYQWLKGQMRGPLVMSYRVNAGAVPPDSWVNDPVQGGGRLIGEVCHMVDLLFDLAGARVVAVHAQAGRGDDMLVSLSFEDGSLGTIVYASGGDRSMPKERLELLGGGRASVLDDFRTAQVHAGGKAQRFGGRLATQDKGHAAELAAFVDAVRRGERSPIDPEGAAHVTRVTFAAMESVRSGLPVRM